MKSKLFKILYVEDSCTDIELTRHELAKSSLQFDLAVVDTRDAYIKALDEFVPDVILCDHKQPSFNSLEALTILRERGKIIPFILVTGSIGEEIALELIKHGADDYVFKDRLSRLSLAILNAVEKHAVNDERTQLLWKAMDQQSKSVQVLSDLSRKLTLATKAANIAIWEYYPITNVLIPDSSLSRVLGVDLNGFTESFEAWNSLVHPDDTRFLYTTLQSCKDGANEFDLHYRMILPGCSLVFVWVKGIAEFDTGGTCTRIVGTLQNVMKQKLREQEISDNEVRYRLIWENTLDGLILGTPDGKLLNANLAACKMLGRTEEELRLVGRSGFVVNDDMLSTCVKERKIKGKSDTELNLIRSDGSTFPAEITSKIFENHRGGKSTITVIRDISARKKLQRELSKQRDLYTELFSAAPSAIGYLSGPDHIFEVANPLFHQLTGNKVLLGKSVKEALPELQNHHIHDILQNVYDLGTTYHSPETCFPLDIDGSGQLTDLYLELVYMPHKSEDGSILGIFFFANNVTQQVNLRSQIAEREKNYVNLYDMSPLPKFVVGAEDDLILSANQRAQVTYGYTSEEFSTMTFSTLFSSKMFSGLSTLACRGTKSITDHVTSNGEKIVVELSVADFTFNGIKAFLVAANNITEQTNLQRKLTDALVSAQRKITKAQIRGQEKEKESIGKELHDNINQQLCSVQLLLNVAKTNPEMCAEVLPKCESVVQSAINDIRSLCKSLVAPSIKDVGLSASISEMVEIYTSSAPYSVQLEIGSHLDDLDADLQTAVYRILQELFTNITKYAEAKKVSVNIKVENAQLSLVVEDDGKGFDSEQKSKGIGLANINSRVKSFGGKVDLQSSPGAGCKCEILIPLHMERAPQSVRILVAEDDVLDQELMKSSFSAVTNNRCDVHFVANGKELLSWLSATPEDKLPSLIVLDYYMPLLDGYETLEKLQALGRFESIPKIIYSTTYHKGFEQICKKANATAFIKKGIGTEEMRNDITRILQYVKN